MLLKISKNLILLFFISLNFVSVVHATDKNVVNQLTMRNAVNYTDKFILGGQPSATDLELLAQNDVELVINLRAKGEFSKFDEQKTVESLGMKYISIEVASARDVNFDNLKIFTDAIKQSNGKTLIHCASGNRVGAFFALDAYKNTNKTVQQALATGKEAGLTRLASRVEELMK